MPMEKALELDSVKNLDCTVSRYGGRKGKQGNYGSGVYYQQGVQGMTADETGLSVDDPFSVVKLGCR